MLIEAHTMQLAKTYTYFLVITKVGRQRTRWANKSFTECPVCLRFSGLDFHRPSSIAP